MRLDVFTNAFLPRGTPIEWFALRSFIESDWSLAYERLLWHLKIHTKVFDLIKPRKMISRPVLAHLVRNLGHDLYENGVRVMQPRKLMNIAFDEDAFWEYTAKCNYLHCRMEGFNQYTGEEYDNLFASIKPNKRFTKAYMIEVAKVNGYAVS